MARRKQHAVITVQGPRKRIEDAAMVGADRMVVCDGVSGGTDGHLASAAVVKLAMASPLERVQRDATSAVRDAAGPFGGTTCTVGLLDGSCVRWLHCGDSALWLALRVPGGSPPHMRRLTEDHSLWGALHRAGREPSDPTHGKSTLLSAVLGRQTEPTTWDTGFVPIPSTALAVWLIGTTDGFHEAFQDEHTGAVDPRALAQGLRDNSSSPARLRALVEKCASTTKDNATLAFWRLV